jgi:glycosyltransferase involved in cell wall biosynthesis
VIEHGRTGFLHPPGDVPGFVESTLRLLGNERLRRTMGRRARTVARERFSVEEMVDRYVAVYDSLR